MSEQEPPAVVREFVEGVRSVEEGETYEQAFDEAVVAVPSRFDESSPTAEWGFDGRLAVTVHRSGG
jgi:hypothetical protein